MRSSTLKSIENERLLRQKPLKELFVIYEYASIYERLCLSANRLVVPLNFDYSVQSKFNFKTQKISFENSSMKRLFF